MKDLINIFNFASILPTDMFREKIIKASILTSFCLIILMLYGCKEKNNSSPSFRTVRITTPKSFAQSSPEGYSGIIEEGKNVNASFMADGRLKSLSVKEGDRVRKGQLLASLDDTDYNIGVNQLKTQLNQMTQEKKRMDEMYARHNVAPNDYEKFSAGYEQLKLQLEMAENKLGYTRLYSPSDGYVSEKYGEPGELVGAGTPIFKITDDSKLTANVDMPVEVYINRNNITEITGHTPAFPDQPIPLTIESFTPDPSNNMLYKMKLLIPSNYAKNLTSGMNIRVEITSNTGNNVGDLVDARSVFDINGKKFVWVYNPSDSTIHKQEVNVMGSPRGDKLNVSGLTNGQMIVETGVKQLYEGEKVNISNNSDYGL